MVLWSVGFLLISLYFLKETISDWSVKKSFWNGFWVVLVVYATATYSKDVYLGQPPTIVTMFL